MGGLSERERRLHRRNAAKLAARADAADSEARIAASHEMNHAVCLTLLVSLFLLVWAKQHKNI